MHDHSISEWDGTTERRRPENCRRRSDRDRRGWIHSITRTRPGVDRRQQGYQRIIENRRFPLRPCSMLTKEEIADQPS